MKDCSNVTQRLIDELQARDRKGFAKYGTTLDRTDLTSLEWLQHAKEEALDFACYLEKLIVMGQSGENAQTPLSTKSPHSSNCEEIQLADFPQLIHQLTGEADAKAFRMFWHSVFTRGGEAYVSRLKNELAVWQSINAN